MINSKDKKKTLGRGLSSLLPEVSVGNDEQKEDGFAYIAIEDISPNPYQPRQNIPLASIMELSESVKEKGVIQPLIISRMKDNKSKYFVIAGERRLHAAKLAGLVEIPALIKEFSDADMAEIAIIENIHRKNLNPIEEGYAFMRLNKEFNQTLETIAAKISKSVTYVEHKIRLTSLPRLIQSSIAVGEISERHGTALIGLKDEEAMVAALKIIIRNNLNVEKTNELVRQIKAESSEGGKLLGRHPRIEWDRKYEYIKEDLTQVFGQEVKLRKNKKDGGSLIITFANENELVSLYEQLNKKKQS